MQMESYPRIRKYLGFNKIGILFKGFFEAQIKYCPRGCFIVEVQIKE